MQIENVIEPRLGCNSKIRPQILRIHEVKVRTLNQGNLLSMDIPIVFARLTFSIESTDMSPLDGPLRNLVARGDCGTSRANHQQTQEC